MGIVYATSETDIKGSATFIREAAQDPVLRGRSVSKIRLVGAFPAGAAGVLEFLSVKDMVKALWPAGADDTYWEFAGCQWGDFDVYNIRGTTPAKATVTLNDVDPKASLIATARDFGTAANNYYIDTRANADDADARDVRIYAQTAAGALYEDSGWYLNVQAADGTVTDPGHHLIALTADGSADDSCAVSTGNQLAGGSVGTLAAGDYKTGMDSIKGESGVSLVATLGVSTSLEAAVNDQIDTLCDESGFEQKMAFYITEDGDSASDVETEVATLRTVAERGGYVWPRVKRNLRYARGAVTETKTAYEQSGHTTLACACNRLDPWVDPMTSEMERFTAAIVGLETENTPQATVNTLDDLGVCVWTRGRNNFTLNDAVTTTLDASGLPVRIKSRRYRDYLIRSISTFVDDFRGRPLDVNHAAGELGPNTSLLKSNLERFLQAEADANRLIGGNPDGTTSPPFLVDFFSESSPTELLAGRLDILIQARETPTMRQIVLVFDVGTNVVIRDAA